MFGLFNRKNGAKALLQTYNTLALCLAGYDLITNPEAKWSEVGADILIHGLTVYSLRENADILLQFFSSSANCFRMGSIYTGLASGVSSVPTLLNIVDMGNHLVNAGVGVLLGEDDEAPRARIS